MTCEFILQPGHTSRRGMLRSDRRHPIDDILMTSAAPESVIPTKSPNDKKLYKHLRLSNGLTVLLISDPEIKKTDENVRSVRG